MNKPHYGLAYPPKPPRWRRRLAILALLLAALYWEYGRYTFEIVELDDGTAPGNAPVILERYVDGERIFVKSYLSAGTNGGIGVILAEPHRTLATTISYAADRFGATAIRISGEFSFFKRRCIAIVRWRAGQPSFEGCSRFFNFNSL
jgi:hypothetical protein